jgi:excisionase family DNA binding protein
MTALAQPTSPIPQWLYDAVLGLVTTAYETGRADATAAAEPVAEAPADTLTRQEAAQLMRISVTTLNGLIGSGEIPSFKIGALRFIRRAAVLAYIERDAQ